MLEMKSKYRMIVVEDSVTGDSKIIIKDKGKFKKVNIGEFIDNKIKEEGFVDIDGREKALNEGSMGVFSVNKDGKVILSKPSKFIRHKTDKAIFEITTTSGKKIKVTEDHSLFTLDEKNILKTIKSKELKEGNFIAIPLKLPFNNSLDEINLLDYLEKFDKKIFIVGNNINEYIFHNRKEIFSIGYSLEYHKSTIQNWIERKILPRAVFIKIKDKLCCENLFIRSYNDSTRVPIKFKLDNNTLSFLGLWLADGCYDKNSVIVSVQEEENRNIVKKVAKKFNSNFKMHSDGFSLVINSTLFKQIMQKVFELNGNSYTKSIPSWAYNLSDNQIGLLLKGFFSGDGCASDKEVTFSSCSKELVDDISTLLLRFNIILRNSGLIKRDNTLCCRIGNVKMINSFAKNIGFLVDSKQKKLEILRLRVSTHDTSDIIPISLEVKEELSEILGKKFNRNDYIVRQNNLGREHLSNLLNFVPIGITNPIDPLRKIVASDIFGIRLKV